MEILSSKHSRDRKKNKTEINRSLKTDFFIFNTQQNIRSNDYRKTLSISKMNLTNNNKMNSIEKSESPIKIKSNQAFVDYINSNITNSNKILVKKFYDNMINFSLGSQKELKKCSVKRIYTPLPIRKKLIKSINRNFETPSLKQLTDFPKNKIPIQENFCNRNNKVAKYFLSETIQKNKSMTFNNKNKISLFNEHILNFKKNPRDILKEYLAFSDKETIKEQKFQELKFRRRMCNYGKTFEKLNKPLFKAVS